MFTVCLRFSKIKKSWCIRIKKDKSRCYLSMNSSIQLFFKNLFFIFVPHNGLWLLCIKKFKLHEHQTSWKWFFFKIKKKKENISCYIYVNVYLNKLNLRQKCHSIWFYGFLFLIWRSFRTNAPHCDVFKIISVDFVL